MKKALCLILLVCVNFSVAQENLNTKEIKSKVDEVTVFLDGAQIRRTKKVQVGTGTTLLKFTNLSPFIRSKTVQIKATGDVTVLGVNHSQNHLEKLEKSTELKELEKKWEELGKEIELEKTYMEVIGEETSFLQENKNIGGKNQALNVNELRSATDFYAQRLTELKLNEITRRERLEELKRDKKDIENQIKNLSSADKFAKGEIHVKIKAKSSVNSTISLTYLVNNAGWNPSYDIRARNVNTPINLSYKANVRQDTKVDWNNVKLTFSSADPSTSGIAPELKTYYLDYNSAPPTYGNAINEVSGFVYDSDNLPLPGVNVIIKGTSIGTQTNFDGYYSLSVPDSDSQLEYSFIGYKTQTKPARNEVQNIYFEEDTQVLEEVVVVGYGSKRNSSIEKELQGRVAGVQIQETDDSETIAVQLAENQTSVEFTIDQPYTIKSDNQSFVVDMKRYDLPATYQYFSAPKVEKVAYLIASVVDWQKYNMLEGEANLFFENTYVGKTILDTRYSTDTLEISLGQDKNVRVERLLLSDFSSKKMVGTRKEESKHWKISVRNNKSDAINLLLVDQVPVSRLDEIKVEIEQKSGGKINTKSGEVSWNLAVDSNNKKEIDLKYSVKYPKNRSLMIE
jgi:hypothetical protein